MVVGEQMGEEVGRAHGPGPAGADSGTTAGTQYGAACPASRPKDWVPRCGLAVPRPPAPPALTCFLFPCSPPSWISQTSSQPRLRRRHQTPGGAQCP